MIIKSGEYIKMKITEKAIEAFKKENRQDSTMIRIVFDGFGWGGPILNVVLDEQKNDDDIVTNVDGIKVVYENILEDYAGKIVIDYRNLIITKGFYVRSGASTC